MSYRDFEIIERLKDFIKKKEEEVEIALMDKVSIDSDSHNKYYEVGYSEGILDTLEELKKILEEFDGS